MTARTRQILFDSHPDTNGGDTSKVHVLIQALKGRKQNRFCIEVGNKVKVGGFWWKVEAKEPKSMFLCRRRLREIGSTGKVIKFRYHQHDFEDMRCGANFAYRMEHI